jgi:hypothetical protein
MNKHRLNIFGPQFCEELRINLANNGETQTDKAVGNIVGRLRISIHKKNL